MYLLRHISAVLLVAVGVLIGFGPLVQVEASGVNGSVRGGGGGGGGGTSSEPERDDQQQRHLKKTKAEGLFIPPPNSNNNGGNGNGNGHGNAFGHIKQTNKSKFKPKPASQKSVANRWMVILSDDTDAKEVETKIKGKAKKFRGKASNQVYSKLMKGGVIDDMSEEDAARLSEEPDVLLVEQDSETHATLAWGQDRIDQRALPFDGIYNPPNDGANVTAYVFDTWVRTTHDEFEGRATVGLDLANDNCDPATDSSHGTHGE